MVDPGFYTRVANYADLWKGILHEQQQKGNCADATSSALAVSDLQLFRTLVFSFQKRMPPLPREFGPTLPNLLAWCRGSRSQMDSFVLSSTAPFHYPRYTECVVRIALMRRFAMNSPSLLWIYGVLARWMLLAILPSISSTMGTVPTTYLPVLNVMMYLLLWSIGHVAVRAQSYPLSF